MKKIFFFLSLSATLFIAACGGDCSKCDPATCKKADCKHRAVSTDVPQEGENAKAVAYDCPMRCKDARSEKPGKCPVCKMDLEEVK